MMRRFVKTLIQIITNTFFRRIDVVGEEHVPATGPVIFAGNHPNALMDGWLLTARCGRWPLHFMANAKLWKYRLMAPLLDASGAVPVYPREEHGEDADNSAAFETLFSVIESGECMGIFPEGVSHVESQLTKLKTGAARIALTVAAKGRADVTIVPCGLNYIHRHRFRSQVLIEFGDPIPVDQRWIERFCDDEQAAVVALTEFLAESLRAVTLNAPDWQTLRFAQAARRLYKPAAANLSPSVYVELNRRFIETYLRSIDDPEIQRFRNEVEEYQTRLEVLGLKDYQLRKDISISQALRRLIWRASAMMFILPLAIPGTLLHLPVGWIASSVGKRFSYEQDDEATLKVFSTIALLPLLYLLIALFIGNAFGAAWAVVTIVALTISFSASVWLIEAQANLLLSIISILRRTRLRAEIDDLRKLRARLVDEVREMANKFADPALPRIFADGDFQSSGVEQLER